jgi:threonine synthase
MIARQSSGGASSATDEEAIEGMKLLAQTEGIFAEAAGGVVVAGLKKLAASGAIKKDQLTVAFITGAGPRTQEIVSDVVHTYHVRPNLESFNEVLGLQI